MGKELDDLLKEMSQERIKSQRELHDQRERNGEALYTTFCLWCNAFKEGKKKNSAKAFAEFLAEEKIELTFWQKKHIAEKYFGYQFEWDNKEEKWFTKKLATQLQ